MTDEVQSAPEPSFQEQVAAAESTPEPVAQESSVSEPLPSGNESTTNQESAPEPEKVVPLAALHEERQRRKELQQQIAQQNQNYQMLQQRLDHLARLAEGPQRQMPDENADPLGYTVEGVKQVSQQVKELREQQAKDLQERQHSENIRLFENAVDRAEKVYIAQKPDYYEAVNFARQRKIAEYEAIGMPANLAAQRLDNEIRQFAWHAIQNGESPAEAGYRMAQAIGYKPSGVSAEQKLAMQQKGISAQAPKGGSGQGGGKLSLDALLKMESKDFLAKTSGDNWKKLVGG